MHLMQELLSARPESTVNEQSVNAAAYDNFKRTVTKIENNLEVLYPYFKDESRLSKLIVEVGGDILEFKAAQAAFNKFYDAISDLHMHTDMAANADNQD